MQVTIGRQPIIARLGGFPVTVDSAALALLNAKADNEFTQSGTGAVSRTVQAKLREGWVSVKDFGAVGDGVTDDSAAFLAALQFMKDSAAVTGFQYGPGGGTLYVPRGHYFLGTTTLDIYCALRIVGDNNGENGGTSTVLRWTAGTTGIRVHDAITSGASGTRAADGFTGAGTIIEGLHLRGGYTSGAAESEAHGIHLRTRATIRECVVNVFPGDGLYAHVTALGGGALEGNANSIFVERCTFAGCRNGIFLQGADANAGAFVMCDTLYNRQWGIYENSFLGNAHIGHHTSGNGVTLIAGSVPPVMVHYAGKHYSVVHGQEVGASTNAPTGTTADNAYWYYVKAGGPSAETPTWASGMTVRAGGPFFSSRSDFISCYSEGDQPVAQFVQAGGSSGSPMQFAGQKGPGYWRQVNPSTGGAVAAGIHHNAGFRFGGNNPNFSGPDAVEIYMYAGEGTIFAYNRNTATYLPLSLEGATVVLKASGSTIADIGSTGLNLATGKVLKVGGTQVVGPRGAAVADATDAASAITQLNALLARCRAHGLIAP